MLIVMWLFSETGERILLGARPEPVHKQAFGLPGSDQAGKNIFTVPSTRRCFEQGASETELALMREGLVVCSAFGQNWGVGINSGISLGVNEGGVEVASEEPIWNFSEIRWSLCFLQAGFTERLSQ